MRHIFLVVMLCFPFLAKASDKIRVVTSIAPIATLFAMIAGEHADIIILSKSQNCPHHHTLKPSELKYIEDADVLSFIDKKFEGFISSIAKKTHGRVFEISKIPNLIIRDSNWHLWLLPSNAILILESIRDLLSELRPEYGMSFYHNYDESVKMMNALEKRRLMLMKQTNVEYILLSHSAEYVFYNASRIKKMYQSDYVSINNLHALDGIIKDGLCCVVLDTSQNINTYNSFFGKKMNAIAISTENWPSSHLLYSLYYNEYNKILDSIEGCAK